MGSLVKGCHSDQLPFHFIETVYRYGALRIRILVVSRTTRCTLGLLL